LASEGQTDEELMALYQEGSEEAFKMLYKRHASKVYGYLLAKGLPSQDAADLFQEVFVKLHRSKRLYRSSLPLLPWIYTISRSVLIDYYRSVAKGKRGVREWEIAQIPENGIIQDFPTEDLVLQLEGTQRKAVQLRYFDEKTFAEIAEILNTSEANVRQIVSRTVKKLKAMARKMIDER
jgi:RNA polymerase sigma-70 factor (ECF subfamily)